MSEIIKCEICGAERAYSPSRNRKPSRLCMPCYGKNRSGALNPNWRGGIKTENSKFRSSPEYRDWRESVFKRDDFACQKCGKVGGDLHAHHLVPFSLDPESRLRLENGQTLCRKCHHETDSFLSKAKAWCGELTTKDRFRFRSKKNFRAYMERTMRGWMWSVNFYRCVCGVWFECHGVRRRCIECHRKASRENYSRTRKLKGKMAKGICSISGCGRPHSGRGYCSTHYSRNKRNGHPLLVKSSAGKKSGGPYILARDVEGCLRELGGLCGQNDR